MIRNDPASARAVLGAGLRSHADVLHEVGGDVELLSRLSALFAEQAAAQLTSLRVAIESRDSDAVESAAHALRGSVGHWGTGAAFQIAARLERMAHQHDLTTAREDRAALEREVSRLTEAVAQLARRS